MPRIICEHLSLGYGDTTLVRDLSFTLEQGDYLCILGENGAGKTTLMKTLLGFQAPKEGRIQAETGGRAIGYLPQQSLIQKDFPASVREVVLSGCQAGAGLRPFYTRREKALAEENMARMGITDLARRCYRTLSGGQQQRVLLARALCATGSLLLLDEPTAGLDPKVTAELYRLIRTLNQEGLTVVMISHDLEAALRDASHILHLGGGQSFFGTAAAYRSSAAGRFFLPGEGEVES